MNEVDENHYAQLGVCYELLAYSNTHNGFRAGRYLNLQLIPPLLSQQFRIYVNEKEEPVGLVTWGWVTALTKKEMIENSRNIRADEWHGGKHLLFNDFVAPWGGVRTIIADLTTNVFLKHKAFSVRRNTDGTVRKVNHWIGKAFLSR